MSTNKKYSEAFKDDAVRYYHKSGETITQVARNLGVARKTLSGWIKEREEEIPQSDSDLYQRILELEKENKQLKMEREILKKAALFFAKETK